MLQRSLRVTGALRFLSAYVQLARFLVTFAGLRATSEMEYSYG